MKIKKVDISMFKHSIYFLFIDDKNDSGKVKKFLTSKDMLGAYYRLHLNYTIKHNSKAGGFAFLYPDFNYYVILIFKKANKYELISTLTHEIDHVITHLCKKLDIKDNEGHAYMTGYINKQIFKKLNL